MRELIRLAMQYVADYSYDDELFLKRLALSGPAQLRLGDLKQLVGLCQLCWRRYSSVYSRP